jgi:hypothetical protein
MGTFILVFLGILFYVFLAKIIYNLFPKIYKPNDFGKIFENEYTGGADDMFREIGSALFPLLIPAIVLFFIFKLPFKAADYISDPSKYNFKIKIERSK